MKTVWVAILFLFFGCSEKSVREEPAVRPTPDLKVSENPAFTPAEPSRPLEELKEIFFDTDRSEIRADQIHSLEYNVLWLKKHPSIKVQIEGHCDERGTREYNIRLGEERAMAIRNHLIQKGIAASRLNAVSYGAISPQSEETWAKHRKAMFVLIYPGEKEKREKNKPVKEDRKKDNPPENENPQ